MKIHANKPFITIVALATICILCFTGCGAGAGAPSQTSPAASESGQQTSVSINATQAASPSPSQTTAVTPSASNGAKSSASQNPSPSASPSKTAAGSDKPLAGFVIGLDPGHQGKEDNGLEPVSPGSKDMKPRVSSGTQGIKSRVEEHVVNLNVALKLRDMLQAAGATVVMTRTKADVDISNKERAQLFNDKKVDLGIRIHCNGIDDQSVHGAFMLVPDSNPYEADCKKAAQLIIDSYTSETGIKKLSTQVRSDQTGFNWCERPIVNIEMGHMSNPAEDMEITDKDFQTTMAQGLYDGIVQYFKQKVK